MAHATTRPGAIDSLFVIGRDPRLNHRFPIRGGVLARDCAERLRSFFVARRTITTLDVGDG